VCISPGVVCVPVHAAAIRPILRPAATVHTRPSCKIHRHKDRLLLEESARGRHSAVPYLRYLRPRVLPTASRCECQYLASHTPCLLYGRVHMKVNISGIAVPCQILRACTQCVYTVCISQGGAHGTSTSPCLSDAPYVRSVGLTGREGCVCMPSL
jgi:hypothetical protein